MTNFLSLSFPLNSSLKIQNSNYFLAECWEQKLVDLLDFNFPLDFDRKLLYDLHRKKHVSTLQHADHVIAYIGDEIKHEALLGPVTTYFVSTTCFGLLDLFCINF